MRIKSSGFYQLSEDEYFADPCPAPSLTQSLAKILLNRSPLHMWHAHPRLNPDFVDDRAKKFDLGSTAHGLLFGRGRKIHLIEAPDWRTKKAKEEREEAIALGGQPVLTHVYEKAQNMVRQFNATIDLINLNGKREMAAIAHQVIWLRTKIDWMRDDFAVIVDYKTTSQELRRDAIPAYAWQHGWHLQQSLQEVILDEIVPETIGRRAHYFVLQESSPPYATYKCRMSPSNIDIGRQALNTAINVFARCLKEKSWPSPSNDVMAIVPPGWAQREALQNEESGDVVG